MKKALIILLIAATVVSLVPVFASAETLDYTPGDVDGNGMINMVDVLKLCQYYVDGCKYDPNGYAVNIPNVNAGDVDGNGVINMVDVLRICQYYVDGCKYDPNGYAVNLLPGKINTKKELAFTSNGNGTCYVSGIGTYTDKSVVIPSVSPSGETVTGIGASAFSGCTFIESVEVPTSVTSIGSKAFFGCTELDSVNYKGSAKNWYNINLGADWDKNNGSCTFTIYVVDGKDNVALNDPFDL